MPDHQRTVQSQFDAAAGAYDRDRTHSASFQAQRAFATSSLQGPFDRILEIGCGPGQMLDVLSPVARAAVGIDLSHGMIRAAALRLPGNTTLLQADACRLPFRDAAFDGVLCMGVLDYAPPDQLLREVARVLHFTGLAVFTVSHAACKARALGHGVRRATRALLRRADPDQGVFVRHEVVALRRSLEALGFDVQAGLYCGVRLVPWPADELFPRVTRRLHNVLESWPALARHAWFGSVFCFSARRTRMPPGTPERTSAFGGHMPGERP
jgi:ubiquinone/menaquinone biosynthesis C-methylase UbiE